MFFGGRVQVGDVLDPAEDLLDVGLFPRLPSQAVFGLQGEQGGELFIDRAQIIVLQDNYKFPAVTAAQVEGGSSGKETIQGQEKGQARETGLEALGHPIEGLEFTILFADFVSWILDKLRHEREDESLGRDEFGFQDRMVIEGFALVGTG